MKHYDKSGIDHVVSICYCIITKSDHVQVIEMSMIVKRYKAIPTDIPDY